MACMSLKEPQTPNPQNNHARPSYKGYQWHWINLRRALAGWCSIFDGWLLRQIGDFSNVTWSWLSSVVLGKYQLFDRWHWTTLLIPMAARLADTIAHCQAMSCFADSTNSENYKNVQNCQGQRWFSKYWMVRRILFQSNCLFLTRWVKRE